MTSKQTLKALLGGACFGFCMTWLLAVILPFIMGVDNLGKFLHECGSDILSFSIFMAGISSVVWLILAARGIKKKKREDLEDAMMEYFRKQNEKEKTE